MNDIPWERYKEAMAHAFFAQGETVKYMVKCKLDRDTIAAFCLWHHLCWQYLERVKLEKGEIETGTLKDGLTFEMQVFAVMTEHAEQEDFTLAQACDQAFAMRKLQHDAWLDAWPWRRRGDLCDVYLAALVDYGLNPGLAWIEAEAESAYNGGCTPFNEPTTLEWKRATQGKGR